METEYLLNNGSYSYKKVIQGVEYYITAKTSPVLKLYYEYVISAEELADAVDEMVYDRLTEKNEAEIEVCVLESVGEGPAKIIFLVDLTIKAEVIPEPTPEPNTQTNILTLNDFMSAIKRGEL